MSPGPRVLVQEWGITHADFFRGLPGAVRGGRYTVEGDTVRIEAGSGRVSIALGPEGERRIASLRLPVTQLEFRFEGLDPSAAEAFLADFSRHYQRGGG